MPKLSASKTKKRKFANREFIRVSQASRLCAGYFNENNKNLRGSSVMGCGRWKAYGYSNNLAEIEIEGDTARMDGHFKCGGVWTCQHCGNARTSQTRSWIRKPLITAFELNNLDAGMITLTMAHTYDGDWSESIDKLHDAFKLFDKNMVRQYRKIGAIGKLKSLEAPIGKNGIHGHFHILLPYTKGIDLAQFEDFARKEWVKAVKKVGGNCNEHGFDFKPNAIGDYLAKHDLAHELANQNTKNGKAKGSTLGQLLDKSARGDKKSSAEWLRAIEALQGRARFHAGNLAKKLGIPNCTDWEDEEQIKEIPIDAPEPVRIRYSLDKHLKATSPYSPRPGLALILRAARTGGYKKVLQIVDALCKEVDKVKSNTANAPPSSFLDWDDDYLERIAKGIY